jgi:hypothetical protein
MLDILLAAGQFLCVMGLVYGVVLTLLHRDCLDGLRAEYNPLAGHDRLGARPARVTATRRPRPLRRPAASRLGSPGLGR